MLWDRYRNMTQELNWITSVSNQPMNPIDQVTDAAHLIKKAVSDQYCGFVANPQYRGARSRTRRQGFTTTRRRIRQSSQP